jgi:hypothetical protein
MAASAALGISVASFGISAASFALTSYRAYQDRQSHASKFKWEYGKDVQSEMSFFTRYRRDCQIKRSLSYTDAFERHDHADDFAAERARGMLGGWWSHVVEEHQKWLLPADFFTQDSGLWLQRAHNYRKLVEPIDQANYKRLDCEKDSGPYGASQNRPSHYAYIEELERKHAHLLEKAESSDPHPADHEV